MQWLAHLANDLYPQRSLRISPLCQMPQPLVRQHWYFMGRVQGVGFRATTREVASRFAVSGYVQNLNDGRVSIVVEATRPELSAFLEAIRQRLGPNINQAEHTEQAATREFDAFIVRH